MIPFSRIFVFVMGLYAALDCKRIGEKEPGYSTVLPRGVWHGCFCKSSGSDPVLLLQEEDDEVAKHKWARYTDRMALFLTALFVYYILVDSLCNWFGYEQLKGQVIAGGAVWLQIFGAWPMMVLMVSLTRDGSYSRTAKILNSIFWKWLGKNSMAIYLVHQVLIGYFAAFYRCYAEGQTLSTITSYTDNGVTTAKPNRDLTLEEQNLAGNALPGWAFVVIVSASCVFGFVITKCIDEPCGRMLRAKKVVHISCREDMEDSGTPSS